MQLPQSYSLTEPIPPDVEGLERSVPAAFVLNCQWAEVGVSAECIVTQAFTVLNTTLYECEQFLQALAYHISLALT